MPVRANSYMFDHGTRPAASPRVMSAATWKRKPSTVSDVPIRAHRYRRRAPGRAPRFAAATSSSARTRASAESPVATPEAREARATEAAPTSSRERAASVAASFCCRERSERRARSTAYAMKASA